MDSPYAMTTTNKRIYDYYKKNPSIDFESMNLVLLDFMDKINHDMSKVLQNTLQGQLLQEVKDIKGQLSLFQDSILGKVSDANKSFVDTLKLLLSMNSSEHYEKVVHLVEKQSESFVDKLTSLLPKTQEDTQRKIQDQLSLLQKTI